MPACSESLFRELAGATMPTQSPGRNGLGFVDIYSLPGSSPSKYSPRQIICAGPSRINSSSDELRCHKTRCTPPSDFTTTGDCTNPMEMAAVAEAQDPVPEEVVGPTPRS